MQISFNFNVIYFSRKFCWVIGKYIFEESLSDNNDVHSHFSKMLPYQEKKP